MHFKGLDLNLLVVLDALCAEQNVTRTGERIHLSQSATSGALARLRQFFGDELLVPVGHKLVLTPLAEGLVEPVRDLLLRAEGLIAKNPAFNPATSTRRFRLMMSDYAATVLMPEALRKIQRLAPAITLELLSNAETPVEVLERGEVDFLIMPRPYVSPNHPAEDLFEDGHVCVVWSGNKLVGDSISLDQYLALGHVGIRFGKQQTPVFDEWFLDRLGHKRRIEVVAMAFNLLPQLVVGTTRIATLPELLARRYARHLPLRLVRPPVDIPRLKQSIQWHKYRDRDPADVWLRSVLRDTVRRSGATHPRRPIRAGRKRRGAKRAAEA